MTTASSESTIQRDPHDTEHPYAQVSRALIRDERLSPNCRWMLIYLLSMKDGWRIKVKQVWKHVAPFIGRAQVYQMIDEAIAVGYMRREDVFKGNLRCGCTYFLSESPRFSNNFSDVPILGIPKTGTHKEQHLKKEHIRKREREGEESQREEGRGGKPPGPPSPKIFIFKKVEMAFEKYEELIKELGEDKTKEMLERLDEYGEINPKRFKQYACHYTVIKKWVRDDSQKPSYGKKGLSPANMSLGAAIKARFGDHPHIYVSEHGVTFHGGQEQTFIKFEDHGFREQVINRLRKMGLDIGGL